MNASTILNDNMTLEEKLKAISDAMEEAQTTANEQAAQRQSVAHCIPKGLFPGQAFDLAHEDDGGCAE
jgi:hypothetical protein